MIGVTRKINDFDNFISTNQPGPFAAPLLSNRTHSPRNMVGNYQSNNPVYPNYLNYQNSNPNFHSNNPPTSDKSPRNLSPNRIANTRKPMISPVRSPRHPLPLRNHPVSAPNGSDRYCSSLNHPPKKAEYSTRVDDQQMFYCAKCATQLASIGFKVNSLTTTNVPTAVAGGKKKRVVPFYPQYQGNKRYKQITELLDGIIAVQGQYRRVSPRGASQHYGQQAVLLNDFYDSLQGIIEKMRADHLADLQAECQRNCQREALNRENLELHLEELLGDVWEDLEHNIETVVEDVEETSYKEFMQAYRGKLQVFSLKLEEFAEEAQGYTTYEQGSLRGKVGLFEQQLMALWEQVPSDVQRTQKNIPEKRALRQVGPVATTIRNVHENLPRPVVHRNCQGEGPFRNLFPEDGQERLPEASPQFKNI